ncbi:MAG: type II secretion system protein [Candidatus Paceibacterota bacterium]
MQEKKLNKITFGFTLIELLVVIAIIAVFSGFLFVLMGSAVNSAKDGRRMGDVSTVAKSLLMTNAGPGGSAYPIETCNIGSDCSAFVTYVASNLQAMPIDPSGGQYYQYSSDDGINFTVCATLSNGYAYCYESINSKYDNYTPTPGACASIADSFCAPQTSSLCAAGTPKNFSGSGPWTWECEGAHTGATATGCTANRTTSITFTTSQTWIIPSCLTTINVEVVGGGGGGGGGAGGYQSSGGLTNSGLGGNAGSQTISNNISVSTLPSSVAIVIGDGGDGGAGSVSPTSGYHPDGAQGTTGTASSFNGTISAPGGTGGSGGSTCWATHPCNPAQVATVGNNGYGTEITGSSGQNGAGSFNNGVGAIGGTGYGAGGGGGGHGECGNGAHPGGNGGKGAPGRVVVTIP